MKKQKKKKTKKQKNRLSLTNLDFVYNTAYMGGGIALTSDIAMTQLSSNLTYSGMLVRFVCVCKWLKNKKKNKKNENMWTKSKQ